MHFITSVNLLIPKYRGICGILNTTAHHNEARALDKGKGGLFMLEMKPQEVCLLCASRKATLQKILNDILEILSAVCF